MFVVELRGVAKQVSRCRSCQLCKTRTRTVFSRGSPFSSLMIVGEAPGENEDLVGKPFVGRSGNLLDGVLEEYGLAGESYICNTIKCRPPNNRRLNPKELESCRPYLIEQLRLVDPAVVLLLGRTAASAVGLPETNWRGQWYTVLGKPFIATYHPAYILRSPDAMKWLRADLSRVKAYLNGE